MGVIHKLKPEIKSLALEYKKSDPLISCRKLSLLIAEKHQIKVSKSSLNALFKEASLSLPVGRRPKKKKQPVITLQKVEVKPIQPVIAEVSKIALEEPALPTRIAIQEPALPPKEPIIEPAPVVKAELTVELPSEFPVSGAILLKAADFLMGGNQAIAQAIRMRLNKHEEGLASLVEGLTFSPLFDDLAGLSNLVGRDFSLDVLTSYLSTLQGVRDINTDLSRIILSALGEVRCVKVSLTDGSALYLDSQFHTVWSTPHIPNDFSTSIYNVKSYISNCFSRNKPFNLFMAPGFDTPIKELFYFISHLCSGEKRVAKLTLYGSKLEELESIPIDDEKKRSFILGMWPWQFVEYRSVKKIGEFKPYFLSAFAKDVYLADIEIELTQPDTLHKFTLRGCALKTSLAEKIRIIILSNISKDELKIEELAKTYLDKWPNLEEAYQDYSSKIELLTYTGSSQRALSSQAPNLGAGKILDAKELFYAYLQALDAFARWHFFPAGYEDKDFSTMKDNFYGLNALVKTEKNCNMVTFHLTPKQSSLHKDLAYALRRLNEREITAFGKRLVFKL